MAQFDFAVVDEAHGTAGDLGRPWAAIHDNARIPADFRLYMTATPRILSAPRPVKGRDGQEMEIASMKSDPDGTYGEWIYELGLSESIERCILAGFEIDVLEIRDPEPVEGESEEAQRGRRLALPKTAAALYGTEVSEQDLAGADELPFSSLDARFYELEEGRHMPAEGVWAEWLCGDHLVDGAGRRAGPGARCGPAGAAEGREGVSGVRARSGGSCAVRGAGGPRSECLAGTPKKSGSMVRASPCP